jgi:hypothetical protein
MEDSVDTNEIKNEEIDRLTTFSIEELEDIKNSAPDEDDPVVTIANKSFWEVIGAASLISKKDINGLTSLGDFQLVTTGNVDDKKLGLTFKGKGVYPLGVEEWGTLIPDQGLGDEFVAKLGVMRSRIKGIRVDKPTDS